MQSTAVSEIYTDLIKTVVALICGTEGVTLVDFVNQLEKFIKQLEEDGFKSEKLGTLLVGVEKALKINDLILLFDTVYSLSTYEGVKIIAEAD
jgi:hypothetical protein